MLKRTTKAASLGALFLAGSLVLGLSACSGSDSESGGGSADGVKIGLITKTDSNPFFVKLREAAQAL